MVKTAPAFLGLGLALRGSRNRHRRNLRLTALRAVFHGVERRLPQGATVYLTGVSPELEGEPCEVMAFQTERNYWLVRFLHPRFNGQSALVPEECLNFGYCVLPEECAASSQGKGSRLLGVRECEDFTGRGLKATENICKGQESPFFITADDVNEVIRAFFMMKANAQKSEGEALKAFNALCVGDGFSIEAQARVQAQAAEVLKAWLWVLVVVVVLLLILVESLLPKVVNYLPSTPV
eukprot:symbB.v1.2.012058.t1/scaffold824.1/size159532/9